MKVTIKIDPSLCIGSGSCVIADPEHFDLNKQGKSEVKESKDKPIRGQELTIEVDELKKEKILSAAKICPTQAIAILDETGKQIFP